MTYFQTTKCGLISTYCWLITHMWRYNQVQFDGDPVPTDAQDFPKEDAIMKGFALEKDKVKVNVLGYLVPKKRKREYLTCDDHNRLTA